MLFKQVTHDDLGCASYLIVDERAGVAAVVDQRSEIDECLELTRYREGVTIVSTAIVDRYCSQRCPAMPSHGTSLADGCGLVVIGQPMSAWVGLGRIRCARRRV